MLPTTNGPQFRYTLRSDLLGARRLRFEPVGWEKLGLTLHRDTKAHGVGTEYSTRLSYVKDGAAYLRRAYEAGGIGADVRAGIEQLLPNEFRWADYYRGRISFLEAELTATEVTVNVEADSWLQKFLSRDTVSVDLFGNTSVSGAASPAPAPVTVALHSRAILQRYAARQQNAFPNSAQMFGDDGDDSHEQVLYFGFDTAEVNELQLGAVAGGFVAGSAATAVPIWTSPGQATVALELALNYHLEIHAQDGVTQRQFRTVDAQYHLRVRRASGDTTIQLRPDLHAPNLLGDYSADELLGPRSVTLQLEAGDGLYLYAVYFVHDLTPPTTVADTYRATIEATLRPGSYLRLSATTTTEPTPTKGLLLYEAFERVAQALTDEVDVFRSDFLGRPDCALPYPADGAGALTLLTGGFQVRGFPLASEQITLPFLGSSVTITNPFGKGLYTTWRELFDSCAAVYGLGWGVEWGVNKAGRLAQLIRVEPLAYWYRPQVVLDLTGLGALEERLSVSQADHYQVAEVSYTQWQAQQVNGLDEFNSQRQYTTPLAEVKETYTVSSQLSASGILLETTRRDRFDTTATTDTGRDATNFLVCLLRTADGGLETERNQQATRLEGVLSPETVYNLRLSPGRILRRHGAVLRAGLLPTAGATVRFTAGEGNTALVSQLVGEAAPVAEGGDVPVADLAAPLWRPERVQVKAPLTRAQLHALLAQPAGRVRYLSDAGRVREGWIVDCTHTASEGLADFTLLPCATLS